MIGRGDKARLSKQFRLVQKNVLQCWCSAADNELSQMCFLLVILLHHRFVVARDVGLGRDILSCKGSLCRYVAMLTTEGSPMKSVRVSCLDLPSLYCYAITKDTIAD